MTAEQLFQVVNLLALAGWLVLAASVIFRKSGWRDSIAGRLVPLILSAIYLVLVGFFFMNADGGFDSLANVQKLFLSPWVALAGWIHYLAFDLFIGSWIARQTEVRELPRWPLLVILPATFLLGPIGLLAFYLATTLLSPTTASLEVR